MVHPSMQKALAAMASMQRFLPSLTPALQADTLPAFLNLHDSPNTQQQQQQQQPIAQQPIILNAITASARQEEQNAACSTSRSSSLSSLQRSLTRPILSSTRSLMTMLSLGRSSANLHSQSQHQQQRPRQQNHSQQHQQQQQQQQCLPETLLPSTDSLAGEPRQKRSKLSTSGGVPSSSAQRQPQQSHQVPEALPSGTALDSLRDMLAPLDESHASPQPAPTEQVALPSSSSSSILRGLISDSRRASFTSPHVSHKGFDTAALQSSSLLSVDAAATKPSGTDVHFWFGGDLEPAEDLLPELAQDAPSASASGNQSDACNSQSNGHDSSGSSAGFACELASPPGHCGPCVDDCSMDTDMDWLGQCDSFGGDMNKLMAESYSLDEVPQHVPSDPHLVATVQEAFATNTSLSEMMRSPSFGAQPLCPEEQGTWEAQWPLQEQPQQMSGWQPQAQQMQGQPQLQQQQPQQQPMEFVMEHSPVKTEAPSPTMTMASGSSSSNSTAATDKSQFAQRETRKQREKRMREANKRNRELRQQLAMAQGTLNTATSLLYDMWSTGAFGSNHSSAGSTASRLS